MIRRLISHVSQNRVNLKSSYVIASKSVFQLLKFLEWGYTYFTILEYSKLEKILLITFSMTDEVIINLTLLIAVEKLSNFFCPDPEMWCVFAVEHQLQEFDKRQ